jgi:hypothetical protein
VGSQYYTVSGDGQRFLLVEDRLQAATAPLEVLLNWRPGVKP